MNKTDKADEQRAGKANIVKPGQETEAQQKGGKEPASQQAEKDSEDSAKEDGE